MTDIYLSCEGIEEILNWNLDQVPDSVRSQLYSMSGNENTTLDILKVKLHEMYELGVGQEYQTYYTSNLGANLVPIVGSTHTVADIELAVALILQHEIHLFCLKLRHWNCLEMAMKGQLFTDLKKGGRNGWR